VVLLAGACALCAGACGKGAGGGAALVEESAPVAAAARNPVTVSPLPGTMDAPPATQISFLGARGTRVSDVRVVGSISGTHSGTLRAYSTGTGESFLPQQPFSAGERVLVSARTFVGGRRGRTAHTTFVVANPAPVAQKQWPPDAGDRGAVQHYESAPQLTPSTVTITTPAQPGASAGDLFLAPYQGQGSPGPMIVDQHGNLVWFHPLPSGEAATNFAPASYLGRPVLSWWQGRVLELGFGQGEVVLYDASYQPVATVHAGNGLAADLHTVRLTPEGTAWIDAYYPVHMNLARAGGDAEGVLSDSIVQEVDVRTGLVMWEWHALGHIPFGDSKNPAPGSSYPWDYAHVNSVDPGPRGSVLMSFRNTWSLDDVDIHSGGFRWRIGGVRSTFKLGPGTRFYWQHDALFQPGGRISVFDNGSDPAEEKSSRGLLLAADPGMHEVRLVRQFVNPGRTLLASSQGDMRRLAGGNWLLGYGGLPDFTEFDAAGRVLLDGTLGHEVQSFTTELAPWSAHAPGVPSLALSRAAPGGVRAAISWNGATDVATWRVLGGHSPGRLARLLDVPAAGFQTTATVPATSALLQAQALDRAGAVIGTSPAVRAP